MPVDFNPTPTERLIMMSLRLTPHQTLPALELSCGAQERKYFRRTLRTLILAGAVTRITADDGTESYEVRQ